MSELMSDLVALSREYGADPRWVAAGGGNTSLKDGDILYVKASGHPLATIDAEGFARMDRRKLAAIWEADYPKGGDPSSVAERERLVLADMMAARIPGEERRPSVETLLHDLLPWPLVVHLHPTLVNGLSCGVDGPAVADELFGDAVCWIPVTDPGYVLAGVIRRALDEGSERGLGTPDFIVLANHGIFVGGADADEVRGKYRRIHRALEERLTRRPGAMPETRSWPADAEALSAAVRGPFGDQAAWTLLAGGELEEYLDSPEAARPLTGCLTPDHIVYAGPGAVFIGPTELDAAGGDGAEAWRTAAAAYADRWGKAPNVAVYGGAGGVRGALVAAKGPKQLENAVTLLKDALGVAAYAESFGGVRLLEERFVRFIVDWEVENYRSSVASTGS